MMLIGRAAGRGAFKGAALVGSFGIIVAAWWWNASLLTAAADANLQLIKIVTSKLPFDWGSKVESDEQELADWRAGRNAVYQLAALTIGARLAVADA